MVALRNILVATDFSECSNAAVGQGCMLAAKFGATIHLLHVVTEPLHEIWACYASGAEFLDTVERLQDEARTRLEEMVSPWDRRSGCVVIHTAWGDPSDQILKVAREHGIELIVCGTRGRRGQEHVMLGSVAERVVWLAPCPVLTVHAVKEKLTRDCDIERLAGAVA
jgi:nucleotide-binding universal stress UspA family protein